MFSRDIYDPRDSRCKSPYGAIPAGTAVRFVLRPPRALGFSRGEITLRFEFDGNRRETFSMPWTSVDRTRDCFSCTVDPGKYVGLIWYSFRLTGFLGRNVELGEYQLTVYDKSEHVPDWFGKGMCYQILPDRFARTKIPDPVGMAGGRTIHRDWSDTPAVGAVGRTPEGRDICNRDFFGGSLEGITEKLPYLASLGVETLYLCPIFEAAENHRYGVADYLRVDPMLGTEQDFSRFCERAHALGMRVLLDGVFNHTGFVSRYFNGDGFYRDSVGAYQSPSSPYSGWFRFSRWPDDYKSWWGIYSLPETEKNDPGWRQFIFEGENSVVRTWLRRGADGWRLDVADELPDDVVRGIHAAARAEKPDAAVIGEVWEDASSKIAYGVRRRHLLGGHLDSVMNYPFRTALTAYLSGGNAADFREAMESLRENYPDFAFRGGMNALGTHDTLRILTLLGTGGAHSEWSLSQKAGYAMTPEERARGVSLLRLGATILFAFPGAPTVYYGDEAGMEGFEDPLNRRTFPWGWEDRDLVDWFSALGNRRKTCAPLREGALLWGTCAGDVLAFTRVWGHQCAAVAVNRGNAPAVAELPWVGPAAVESDSGKRHLAVDGVLRLNLPPMTALQTEQAVFPRT